MKAIAEQLKSLDNIVICGHVSPDGDCIGSQLALAAALCAMGKQATCLLASDEPIDFGLRFLPGADRMVPAKDFDGTLGAFVSVDVPNEKRMGSPAAKLHAEAPFTIMIDHHPSDAPMSMMNFVDAGSPATALLIWELVGLMGIAPDKTIATCCYTGLCTDTGRFQYQNTTAESFAAASQMIAAGAEPSQVAQQVYQNRSFASLQLESVMLQHLERYGDGAFVLSYLSLDDFKEIDATKSDAEPLIDVIRSLRGVRVACILREQDECVRGSLRAKDDTDVAAIANKIGGGGHKAAAGFTFEGTLDQARACIVGCFQKLDTE